MTTVADLLRISNGDPFIAGILERATISSYEDFIRVLYADLHRCVKFLESQAHVIEDEHEDSTTGRILTHLDGAGYSARPANRGGNVDLVIELSRLGYTWIGEAKKFDSVADLREGYLQLATRYVPGSTSTGKSYGGLFGYLRRPNAVQHVEEWKREFLTIPIAQGAKIRPCNMLGPFAFYSEHNHQASGAPFEVWHVCLKLLVLPQDKSAVTSKKGSARIAKFKEATATGTTPTPKRRGRKPKP